MNIRERSTISAPAAQVWPYIVTAELFRVWNDKIIDIEAQGEFRGGQTFHTGYRMSKNEIRCWSKVTALEPERLLELHHGNCTGQGLKRDIEVIERITLEEKDGRTIVTKEVVIRNSEVPWFFIPLIWLITRFGKPVGKDKLKEMCEGESD
jgi:uncharacterized protein YndB with AHSA1/START domain